MSTLRAAHNVWTAHQFSRGRPFNVRAGAVQAAGILGGEEAAMLIEWDGVGEVRGRAGGRGLGGRYRSAYAVTLVLVPATPGEVNFAPALMLLLHPLGPERA